MKKILIITAILITFCKLYGQRVVDKQVEVKQNATIDLKLEFADSILIKPSTDSNFRIKAVVSINDNQHNDNYELNISEGSESIKVKAKIRDMESIHVPCKNHKGTYYGNYNDKCLTMAIRYEIELPASSSLRLETISGNIMVQNAKNPMIIKSISGFIDINISPKFESNIQVETVTGGVYSNFDINKDNGYYQSSPGGTDANLKIGKGGCSIKLETISGDIFIRKN